MNINKLSELNKKYSLNYRDEDIKDFIEDYVSKIKSLNPSDKYFNSFGCTKLKELGWISEDGDLTETIPKKWKDLIMSYFNNKI